MSHREILEKTGLSPSAVWNGLKRCWDHGFVLRTKTAIYETENVFRGRKGSVSTTRPYHLYLKKPVGLDSVRIDGVDFVSFSKEYLDPRGGGSKSKASRIRDFISDNPSEAFFSIEIAEKLSDHGVKIGDIMSTVRRMEKKRTVYVRGYRYNNRETPFTEGYLITWIDLEKPREQALEEAIDRTKRALESRASTNPFIQRVHTIKDMVFEASKLRDVIDFYFILNKLGCTEYEAERALKRAQQLYPEIQVVKLFGLFRHFYHITMPENELSAILEMKKNYIRIVKGRDNRIGHNWEAVPGWFIDKFTTGAKFWTQKHRTSGMDPRRITIHLIKSVGNRRNNAEVDRVWEVTPGLFSNPITYVLECKWGLVNKRELDDFFEVLRWSKEFGVDTPDGRAIKQGINAIFAASSFNPTENVTLRDGNKISLSHYANRMNIQLLRASDFNAKLRERGVPNTVTAQKICKSSQNEKEVRSTISKIWDDPKESITILAKITRKNKKMFEFEEKILK
jgi:hypothetical protein